MKITDIKETDNGEWECSVTAKGSNGDLESGIGNVKIIVAVPPETVELKMDGQAITGKDFWTFWNKICKKLQKSYSDFLS